MYCCTWENLAEVHLTITFRHGLPVTTLPRTLVDLIRSGIDEEWIRQAVRQASAVPIAASAW